MGGGYGKLKNSIGIRTQDSMKVLVTFYSVGEKLQVDHR